MSKNKAAPLTNEQKIIEFARTPSWRAKQAAQPFAFDMDDFLASKRDDPSAAFTEWPSEADEKAYRKLKLR